MSHPKRDHGHPWLDAAASQAEADLLIQEGRALIREARQLRAVGRREEGHALAGRGLDLLAEAHRIMQTARLRLSDPPDRFPHHLLTARVQAAPVQRPPGRVTTPSSDPQAA